MRHPCPAGLVLVVVAACGHSSRDIDEIYQQLCEGRAITPNQPVCLETGVTAASDERTPLGFSAAEAVQALFGGVKRADVVWFPRIAVIPDRLPYNAVRGSPHLDIEVTLSPDTPVEVVSRLSRWGKRVCPYERGYLRFPVTVTISEPSGLFSLSGVENMYVSSLDQADPESWQIESRYTEEIRNMPLSGTWAAVGGEEAGAIMTMPLKGMYRDSPRGGNLRLFVAGTGLVAELRPSP